jgi:uncharacterized membrane protein YgdD (TMEM256/DUF423 family)
MDQVVPESLFSYLFQPRCILLGGSAIAGYAAVRGAVDALLRPNDTAPAKRAALHAAMTAIICLAAMFHHPALLDVAVGVPFSATVAALTLALGVVLFVGTPSPHPAQTPLRSTCPNRVWAFLLPTGLLTLLIGFTGRVAPRSALILAAEGAAILVVCLGPRTRAVLPLGEGQADSPPSDRGEQTVGTGAILQVLFSLALAVVAGWGMVQGASGLSLHDPAFRPGVAAVLALGPAIVLPMIPPLATLAERGKRDQAATSLVGFALINLCVVLPLVVVAQQFIQMTSASTQPAVVDDLPFPILVWRLDTVLLTTIGLLLLPAAIGRWALARAEGFGLVMVYVIYLFLTLLISNG